MSRVHGKIKQAFSSEQAGSVQQQVGEGKVLYYFMLHAARKKQTPCSTFSGFS